MPFPSVPPTGYAPSTVTTPVQQGPQYTSSGAASTQAAQYAAMLGISPAEAAQQLGISEAFAREQATATRDGLLTELSYIGGTDAQITPEELQANPAFARFAAQAQAAGFDPMQLLQERNRNIYDSEHGMRMGRWFERTGLDDIITYGTIAAGLAGAGVAAAGAGGGAGGAGAASGAGGAGAGTAATTFPYAAGGTITGSAIPGITSATTAANAAAAGILPAAGIAAGAGAATNALTGSGASTAANAASGAGGAATNALTGAGGAAGNAAGNVLSNVPDWVGNYLLPGLNAALGVNAANQASDAMAGAYDRAIQEGARQYDTTRNDLMPWLDAGRTALGQLADPNTNFMASPDYEFRRSEGERGIGNSFAARGGAASGNALRALSEYNSNLAAGEFGDWWNRRAGLAGVGQTTGTTLGQLGANTAANAGNFLAGQGASRASGVLGRTNAVQNGIYDGYQNFLYRRRA